MNKRYNNKIEILKYFYHEAFTRITRYLKVTLKGTFDRYTIHNKIFHDT